MIKKIIFPLMALCTIACAFTSTPVPQEKTGFALIELFTSEGCSSCPPADALVAKIAQENTGKPVYILAYHVDYWDRLGWKDRFSDHRYAERQDQYAKWLGLSTVYTPQIVVNGHQEFVGSEEQTLRNAIARAQSTPHGDQLLVSVERQEGTNLTLKYQTEQQTKGYNLLVSVILPKANSKVARGENKGRVLSHVQIVNTIETFALNGKDKGVVHLSTGKGNPEDRLQVIAFLQEMATGKITAVIKLAPILHG